MFVADRAVLLVPLQHGTYHAAGHFIGVGLESGSANMASSPLINSKQARGLAKNTSPHYGMRIPRSPRWHKSRFPVKGNICCQLNLNRIAMHLRTFGELRASTRA